LRASELRVTGSSQYLLEMRNSELLTKEEEALLATRAQVRARRARRARPIKCARTHPPPTKRWY
jgi:hypothetical protein